jgi:hypothetical protein
MRRANAAISVFSCHYPTPNRIFSKSILDKSVNGFQGLLCRLLGMKTQVLIERPLWQRRFGESKVALRPDKPILC